MRMSMNTEMQTPEITTYSTDVILKTDLYITIQNYYVQAYTMQQFSNYLQSSPTGPAEH